MYFCIVCRLLCLYTATSMTHFAYELYSSYLLCDGIQHPYKAHFLSGCAKDLYTFRQEGDKSWGRYYTPNKKFHKSHSLCWWLKHSWHCSFPPIISKGFCVLYFLGKQQQLEAEHQDTYVEADHDLHPSVGRSAQPPAEKPGERRLAEMKKLYGEGASKIQAMETTMQLSFDRNCDKKQPKYWPIIPLKLWTVCLDPF